MIDPAQRGRPPDEESLAAHHCWPFLALVTAAILALPVRSGATANADCKDLPPA